ncbi:hypothetical protein [Laspinema olomoucense]|uniref:hypothetical protein n=1 Tax=Laspinema olomoucense TaxID=3231600 RepID=UPI0021BBA598|nr:hypothetical protein [Laspinema sp. D3c]MCT7993768.1 hypothetical protein [Laspinema sp. D3c]
MKRRNRLLFTQLLQILSGMMSKKVEPEFLLELLNIASAIITLSAVSPVAGLAAGGVAVYWLISKGRNNKS